ncbi:hypothetical protein WBG78_15625 [Chryseolinea sp. T2]|uniref:hypothetical protein n=1 Tax=Chryseolinea sp. T2 TaxID=3129255 RepID=UPI003076D559
MSTSTKVSQPEYISVRFGSLLPWPFHFGAGVGIFIAIGVGAEHPWTALTFAVCSLFVFTSSEGTDIDLVNRRFREYTSIFFFKTGKWVAFDAIEKIYVNRNKMRQNVTPTRTGFTSSFTFDEFSAFLKFNEYEVVQLIKDKNKDVVMKRSRIWSEQMNIPLYDNAGDE